MKRSFPALLCVLLGLTGGAHAADRWSIGLDTVSSTIGSTADDGALTVDERAPGGGLQMGYAFDEAFLLRLYVAGADHATNDPDVDLRFAGGTLDLCYRFRPGQALRPYVFGGLGGYALESQQDALLYEVQGTGAAFGGGILYRLGRRISLHASARIEAVNWETVRAVYDGPGGSIEVETPIDDSGSAVKLTLGMLFHL
jgi:hypothetical protein